MVLTRQMLKRMKTEETQKGRNKIGWEDLDVDCLANVMRRVGMESLLLAAPFVCKSWYASSFSPLSWQRLYFPDFEPSSSSFYDRFVCKNRFGSINAFVKNVVSRSNGKTLELKLPGFCSKELVTYVANECPELRVLHLPDDLELFKSSRIVHTLFEKWKFLEKLSIGGNFSRIMTLKKQNDCLRLPLDIEALLAMGETKSYPENLSKIVEQIGIHCKDFRELEVADVNVGKEEARTIVKSLPNLNILRVRESYFEVDSLLTILRGCKKLERLDVRNCEGFEGEEANIAASYPQFRCEGRSQYDLEFHKKWRYSILCTRKFYPRMSTGGRAPRYNLVNR